MQSGWRVGKLFGIPIFLDYSWFAIAALITLFYAVALAEQFPEMTQGMAAFWGVLASAGLFASILMHEICHSVVALAHGLKVRSVTLFVFGGVANIEREAPTAASAFWVALAGPAFNLSLFALLNLLLLSGWIAEETPVHQIVLLLADLNLFVGIFNLLPGLPLDGGQILRAIVWGITGDKATGILWASRSGQWLGMGLIGLGILSLLQGVPGGLWIALVGWFILGNARMFAQANRQQEALEALKAVDAMSRRFRVLDLSMTVREFVDRFMISTSALFSGSTPLPKEGTPAEPPEIFFAEADGRYKGMIRPDLISGIERSQWEKTTLEAILRPMTDLQGVREDAPLKQAVLLMQHNQATQIPVFTPTGAIAGLIDKGDVVSALGKKMGLKVPVELLQQIRSREDFPPGLKIQEPLDPAMVVGKPVELKPDSDV